MAKRKKKVTEGATYDSKPDPEVKTYSEQMESCDDVLELLLASQFAERDMRDNARECHLFVTERGGQWEPFWWANNAGKPRYSFDMTSPIVDQIMGEIEQSEFDIRVSPAGGASTKELALTYDGIIRNIENISDAKTVYKASARNMVVGGFDAWRVVQKYQDADSFDQDLMIEPIFNAIDRVWFDPTSQKQDRSDARWVVVLHAVGIDEYKTRWPDGACSSVGEGRDANAYWYKADVVIIGEILYCMEVEVILVQMSNGTVYKVDDDFESIKDELATLGITEIKRRSRMGKEVYSRLFDAGDWLEEASLTVFHALPVVPVYGNFKVFEDKTLYQGVVDKQLDPQRVLNYSMSREIEEGALAPRAKYWMTKAQATGHESTLGTLNTNADPVQFFNFDPAFPQVPQQQGGAQINPGLRTISEAMRQIIGQTSGMFAANMGDNPGLQSGVAIDALQNKGDNGTIKYFKALEFAISYTGRLLVKAIPKVYDTQRQMRLMYDDGSDEVAVLNQPVTDQQTGRQIVLNDLSQGEYDVVCRAGPSFRNRQEETVAALLEMAKADPSILQLGGDLLLKSINTPVSEQLAERKRAQMVDQGLIPESQLTDEEKQALQKKEQGQQQQDPNMVLAQAEMAKGQAELMNAQTEQMKVQIDGFNAQTNRIKAIAEAQEKGVKIELLGVDIEGKQLDNILKIKEMHSPYPHTIPKPVGQIRQ